MRPTKWWTAAAAVGLLVLAACGDNADSGSGSGPGGIKPPKIDKMASLGAGEGSVNIIAWAGYVENGSTDPKVDWVTGFEKETGCKVNVKIGATSDEMVTLMKTGEYDTVSASGDASLRLIYGGDVAPVNTDLIPNYKDVFDGLKNKAWNSVDGVSYGVPHGRGANLLMYRTDSVNPAPTSWSAVFDPSSPYKGKVTAYDSPIYIADAALYLMKTKPDLGIKNPYELNEAQYSAALELLRKQHPNVHRYWHDANVQVQDFTNEGIVASSSWPFQVNTLVANKQPIASTVPEEGATGWADTTMLATDAKHPNCAY